MEKIKPIIETVNGLILSRDLDFLSLFGNKKGEDEPFLQWLKTQPCKRCGFVPHHEMDMYISCIPCHVRAVNKGAGTGIKPQWNATSLCFDCHHLDHNPTRTSSLGSREEIQGWADQSLTFYIVVRLRQKLGFKWIDELPSWLSKNMPDHRTITIQ